jgi:hypothetical protein
VLLVFLILLFGDSDIGKVIFIEIYTKLSCLNLESKSTIGVQFSTTFISFFCFKTLDLVGKTIVFKTSFIKGLIS